MQICFNATKLHDNKAEGFSCFMNASDATAFSSVQKTLPARSQMVHDRPPALSEDSDLAETVSIVLNFNSNKMQSFTSSISSLDSLKKINGVCMCMPKRCMFQQLP